MNTPDQTRPRSREERSGEPGAPVQKSGREQLRRFLPVLRPYRGRLVAILGLQALGTLLGLASPFLIQQAIDRIIAHYQASSQKAEEAEWRRKAETGD